jgi:hypothetical protein
VRGPILLEDYHLVEKLANFDRERIPERVVHARGASAKGFFEVGNMTENIHRCCYWPGKAEQLAREPGALEVWQQLHCQTLWLLGNTHPMHA